MTCSIWEACVLMIILLCFTQQPVVTTGYLVHDMELLKAFRNSLVQKRDVIPSWSDTKTTPCNWTGVKCEGERVIRIDFPCSVSPLNLPFPGKNIGKFRSLKHLNLNHCALSGNIPTDVWSLENLETLDLTDNRLTGQLSPTISNLRNLKHLVLDDNGFSGSLPSTICELKELRELSVHANSFSGDLSDEIGNLDKLQSLDFSSNFFSGSLPSSLVNLAELLYLDASLNNSTGLICPEIGKLSKLRIITLSSNMLTGTIPGTIGRLKQLEALDLQNCKLTGSIPEEILELSYLNYLNVAQNEFNGELPLRIGKLESLVYLIASNAGLSGTIPSELGNCKKLKLINLSFNSFSGPLPEGLSGLDSLKSFVLDSIHLSVPLPMWIDNWTQVESIIVSKNFLTGSLPPLYLPLLSVLDVSSNRLSSELSSGIYLVLSGNNLSGKLPDYLGELQLINLKLSKNQFSGKVPDLLWESKTLMSISLGNNVLEVPIQPTIAKLSSLQRLQLDRICEIPRSISKLKLLDNLVLSNNQFSGPIHEETCTGFQNILLPDSEFTQHYGMLDLSNYELTESIPHSIKNCIVVTELLLQGNKLTGSVPREISLLGLNDKPPRSYTSHNQISGSIPDNFDSVMPTTENYSKSYIIGDGGFGTVYKAKLPEGRTTAVKRLNRGNMHGDREFFAEMETIGNVKHDNLVPLLGYCVSAAERLLIYEYMENESLDFWLRNQAEVGNSDIKSSNILLDRNFEARVSDFGLARIIKACESHVSTILAGSLGYIPPEYGQTMMATSKGDIYSFGVVMLELVTGQADVEGGNLIGCVRWMVANGREIETLDPFFSGSRLWKDQMLRVLAITRSCTNDEQWKRPTMRELTILFIVKCASASFLVELRSHNSCDSKYVSFRYSFTAHSASDDSDDFTVTNKKCIKHEIYGTTNAVHHPIACDPYFSSKKDVERGLLEYKVLRLVVREFRGCPDQVSELEVHTLEIDEKWRNVGQDPSPYLGKLSNVNVNGALHWLEDKLKSASIYSLNIRTEEVKPLLAPPSLKTPSFNLTLAELGNCLCLSDSGCSQYVDIWWMKEYGIAKSWTKYRILTDSIPLDIRCDGFIPVIIWKDG
ncbi:leucine-rich repeat receptor protein kinase MSP1-like [Lycium barbarum]|uniref:leucine-rich repeat receptor protein kinase MSP1-like n=1 Tax=Lycium barbarum TaxID=112863 RepID=UPI00293E3FE7|nr:leucine-rich repeat receptor protein kinase MSP1-like [Lycium barbarum]